MRIACNRDTFKGIARIIEAQSQLSMINLADFTNHQWDVAKLPSFHLRFGPTISAMAHDPGWKEWHRRSADLLIWDQVLLYVLLLCWVFGTDFEVFVADHDTFHPLEVYWWFKLMLESSLFFFQLFSCQRNPTLQTMMRWSTKHTKFFDLSFSWPGNIWRLEFTRKSWNFSSATDSKKTTYSGYGKNGWKFTRPPVFWKTCFFGRLSVCGCFWW